MSETIYTVPIKIQRDEYITKIKVKVQNIQFNQSVTFQISFPGLKQFIPPGEITLNGEDYQNWMNDDAFIINTLLQKLNLQLNNGLIQMHESQTTMSWLEFINQYQPYSPDPDL